MSIKEDCFVVWDGKDRVLAVFEDENNAHKFISLEQHYEDKDVIISDINELRELDKELADETDELDFRDDEYKDIPDYLYAIKIGDEFRESRDNDDDDFLSYKAARIEEQYLKDTAEEMYGVENLEELSFDQIQGVRFQNGFDGGNVEYVEVSCEEHEDFYDAYQVYDPNPTNDTEEYEEEDDY